MKLKGPCAAILGVPSIGASNARLIADQLNQIHQVLQAIPTPAEQYFPEPLVKYVVFTLFHIFRLLNRFTRRETRFDFLVEPWLACLQDLLILPHAYTIVVGRSIDDARAILEALLIMVDGLPIASDPSTPASNTSAKGDPRKAKKDRMADDVRLQAVRCLISFIPIHHPAQPMPDTKSEIVGENMEDEEDGALAFITRPVPSPADHLIRQQLLNPEDPRNDAVVGQMIVILLDTGSGAASLQLRVAGMEAIDRLLHCFNTPTALARWMPGVLAGLTGTMLEKGLMDHHSVPVKALQVMSYLITTVLRDKDESGEEPSRNLNGRTKEINADNIRKMMESQGASTSKHGESTPTSDAAGNVSPPRYGTTAWLQKTRSALKVLFKRITNIRAHTHWRVRREFGEFAFSLLRSCHGAVGDNAQFLLETLIACSQDEFQAASQPAKKRLLELTTLSSNRELENVGVQVLRGKLLALPRVLHGPEEETVRLFAIKTLCGLVLYLGERIQILVQQQLWETIQPWLTLLTIDRLDGQHIAMDRQGVLAIIQQASVASDVRNVLVSKALKEHQRWNAWIQHLPKSPGYGGSGVGFPRKIFRFLYDQAVADTFQSFLRQVGFSTDVAMWYGELLAGIQSNVDGEVLDESTISSIVLLNQLLLGAAGVGVLQLDEGAITISGEEEEKDKARKQQKRQRRHVQRIARDILGDYLEILSKLDFSVETIPHSAPSTTTNPDVREGHNNSNLAVDSKAHIQLACVLLEGIASIAIIVGENFEDELIRVLYPLLELLSDPDSSLVRESAEATLNHIAFVTGYDSIGDLLNENYDYVVQQVSQRIAFISRNPNTPQVLISLIRVVGPRAVAMLEDSVTEIMIALDMQTERQGPVSSERRGREYTDQASEGLLKALCEITRAMALERTSKLSAADKLKEEEEATKQRNKYEAGMYVMPSRLDEASIDVLRFAKQYRILVNPTDRAKEEEELSKQKKMSPTEIRQYFMDRAAKAKKEKEELLGESDDEDDDDSKDDEESFGKQKRAAPAAESKELPPTKHEALCLRIFNKAGYFLSSSSPRMRVLSLEIILASIQVLRYRPNEFYPAIHDLWGSIMARLRQDPEFFVSLRAIEVVTALADHCSDFLKKKLLDDVWPFVLQALRVWTRKVDKVLPSSSTQKTQGTSATSTAHSVFSTPSSNNIGSNKKATSTSKLFTREHRLQMTTLQSVSKIVRVIQAPVKDIWEMILLTCEFLDEFRFHVDIQEAAVQLIKDLAQRHGDPVWLALTETIERDERRVKRFGEAEGDKIGHCTKLLHYLEMEQL
ncbi:hypothetical protein BGW41_008238 [Actinomortierella wolfii]|nr:hypothetical protein BGW41_008238 [Actinomortierella wolfii]